MTVHRTPETQKLYNLCHSLYDLNKEFCYEPRGEELKHFQTRYVWFYEWLREELCETCYQNNPCKDAA